MQVWKSFNVEGYPLNIPTQSAITFIGSNWNWSEPDIIHFFCPPSSRIASCVRTIWAAMCLLTWRSPALAVGWALIQGLYPDLCLGLCQLGSSSQVDSVIASTLPSTRVTLMKSTWAGIVPRTLELLGHGSNHSAILLPYIVHSFCFQKKAKMYNLSVQQLSIVLNKISRENWAFAKSSCWNSMSLKYRNHLIPRYALDSNC